MNRWLARWFHALTFYKSAVRADDLESIRWFAYIRNVLYGTRCNGSKRVDKSFLSALSDNEQSELSQLWGRTNADSLIEISLIVL